MFDFVTFQASTIAMKETPGKSFPTTVAIRGVLDGLITAHKLSKCKPPTILLISLSATIKLLPTSKMLDDDPDISALALQFYFVTLNKVELLFDTTTKLRPNCAKDFINCSFDFKI